MRKIFLLVTIMTITACATVSRHPVAGTWDVTITSPRGENTGVVTLTEDMTGTLTGTRGRVTELTDIIYEDGQLTFSMVFETQQRPLNLTFTGTIDGDSLTGIVKTPFAENQTTGTRRPLE